MDPNSHLRMDVGPLPSYLRTHRVEFTPHVGEVRGHSGFEPNLELLIEIINTGGMCTEVRLDQYSEDDLSDQKIFDVFAIDVAICRSRNVFSGDAIDLIGKQVCSVCVFEGESTDQNWYGRALEVFFATPLTRVFCLM